MFGHFYSAAMLSALEVQSCGLSAEKCDSCSASYGVNVGEWMSLTCNSLSLTKFIRIELSDQIYSDDIYICEVSVFGR